MSQQIKTAAKTAVVLVFVYTWPIFHSHNTLVLQASLGKHEATAEVLFIPGVQPTMSTVQH